MDIGDARKVKLLFVYNAEAGLVQGFLDSVHKVVSPQTYECDLCAITYGLTSMKPQWRDWLKGLGVPVQFYHRADFHAAWPGTDVKLPVILAEREGEIEILVGAEDFKSATTVDGLIALLEGRLDSHLRSS
jgi:hypothetical protein